MSVTGKGRRAGTRERWAEIMGTRHAMSQRGLSEAIPPAYTEYIGTVARRGLETGRKL